MIAPASSATARSRFHVFISHSADVRWSSSPGGWVGGAGAVRVGMRVVVRGGGRVGMRVRVRVKVGVEVRVEVGFGFRVMLLTTPV